MALIAKFGTWLLTDAGKHFSLCVATATGLGVFSLKALPNTVLIDQYKEMIHLYRKGMRVELTDVLKQRFEKALDLSDIPEKERKLFKPFSVYGFDMFHAGTAYSKFGCIIGLPLNFRYTDVDSIDTYIIKINNESVVWGLDEGQQLLHSLVLSEKAQVYAIAREIKMAQSAKMIFDTMAATLAVIMCYGISSLLNRRLNLYQRPLLFRVILYTLAGGFCFGNYAFVKDFTQIHYEQAVDKSLKEKDPMLVEGGKEFYEKLLSRNQALRKLLGKAGESQYTVMGNENYLLRQRHLPLLQRKEFFEVA